MDHVTFQHACTILDAIIDAPVSQRAELLARHCADNRRLHDHLWALLQSMDSDEFLASPIIALSDDAPSSADMMISRVGPYELLRLIGEGGMGAVYEARQESPSRLVAVKLLRAGMFSTDASRRFARESQVLGLLHHPGIAQIYEAGTAATPLGEVPYFAMELIRGLQLGHFCGSRNLSTRAKLELMAHISDAVDHAHRHGVIHRDLKPANILIELPDSDPTSPAATHDRTEREGSLGGARPKILDFGVARAAQSLLPDAATLHTDAGQIIGTLSYMSPEQMSGDPARIDARTDVYSLGVIAYELLARRLPIDVKGRAIPDISHSILHDEPTRLRTLDSRFAGDIDTIIAKAIEKDPARRYQSAAALAADLRRFLRDEPIVARPATSLYQLRKFARRNRVLVAGIVACVLILLAGTTTTTYWALRAIERRALAESRADELQRRVYRASIAAAQSALDKGQAIAAREYLLSAPQPLRGWEWRYLDSLVDRSERTIDVHAMGYVSIALAGEFAFLHRPQDALLLNWKTGERTLCQPCPVISTAYALGVSPTRDRFVVCGELGSALWDMRSGQLLTVFDAGPRFESTPFSADGSVLVLGSLSPRRINVFNAADGSLQRSITVAGVDRLFPSMGFDQSRALSEVTNNSSALLDIASGQRLWEFPGVQPRCTPDGRSALLYSGLGQQVSRLHVLDLESGTERFALDLEDCQIWPSGSGSSILSMSPDGSLLAYLTTSGGIRLISTSDRSTVGVLSGLGPRRGGTYHGAAFSDDGRWLAACSSGYIIKVWDISRCAVWTQPPTKEELFGGAASISSDDSFSVTSNWGEIVAWDLATAAPRWAAHPSFEFFVSTAISPDGARVYVGGDRGTLLLLDAHTGNVLRSTIPHGAAPFGSGWVRCLAYDTRNHALLAGFNDGTLMHLHPDSLVPIRTQSLGSSIVAVCPAPIADRFACITAGSPDRVLVFSEQAVAPSVQLNLSNAATLAWSPDGTILAVGHAGGIRTTTSDGLVLSDIPSTTGLPTTIRFTPRGDRLIAGTSGASLGIWLARSGELCLELPLPRLETALAVKMRADEQAIHVVTTGSATVAFEIDKPEQSLAHARDIVRRARELYRSSKAGAVYLPETLALIAQAAPYDPAVRDEAARHAGLLCEHPASFNNQAYMQMDTAPDEATLHQALRQSESAIARCPDPIGLLTRGKVLFRAQRFDEALAILLRANQEVLAVRANWGSGPPELAAIIGICYARTGKPDLARHWFGVFDRVTSEPRYLDKEDSLRWTDLVQHARQML